MLKSRTKIKRSTFRIAIVLLCLGLWFLSHCDSKTSTFGAHLSSGDTLRTISPSSLVITGSQFGGQDDMFQKVFSSKGQAFVGRRRMSRLPSMKVRKLVEFSIWPMASQSVVR